LEETGQKHTDKDQEDFQMIAHKPERYQMIDGELWYVQPNAGKKQKAMTHQRKNKKRMFVNGKYIPTNHPLHKPGSYKNFEDAAFSSLEKYKTSTQGQVYIVYNENFPEWVKVGMAVDAEDRLNNYQTSSPYRDYVLYYKYDVNDRRKAESEAHRVLNKRYEKQGEWFKCTVEEANKAISELMEQYK